MYGKNKPTTQFVGSVSENNAVSMYHKQFSIIEEFDYCLFSGHNTYQT